MIDLVLQKDMEALLSSVVETRQKLTAAHSLRRNLQDGNRNQLSKLDSLAASLSALSTLQTNVCAPDEAAAAKGGQDMEPSMFSSETCSSQSNACPDQVMPHSQQQDSKRSSRARCAAYVSQYCSPAWLYPSCGGVLSPPSQPAVQPIFLQGILP